MGGSRATCTDFARPPNLPVVAVTRALHVKRRPWRSRLVILTAAIVAVAAAGGAALAVALTNNNSAAKAQAPGHIAAGAAATSTTTLIAFAMLPPDGATNLPLDTKVTVSASGGHLTSVVVTSADGTALAGTLDSTGQSWQSTAALAAHAHYTVTAQGTGSSGKAVQRSSSFSTLTPTAILSPIIFPNDGLTVGVGMPIELRFNHSVANKSAVLAALHVTMSTPVPGGWHWFSDRELHFRPQTYWPAGDQVTLTANLAGVDAGNGVWAEANHSVHFTIGDAHISTADVGSHFMTVTTNGKVVGHYPLSAGRTKYPTMNGVHIALYRQQDVVMDSATVGIPRNSPDGYYEHVFWDVAITDGGEFVHAAPWSTGAQGSSNVSHGCINLSVANATTFFNFSRVGDIIQVVNSPRPASLSDHGTMDWSTPWAQWTPAT
jgi:lipoprotein-anchoring transpeptidase ErfK/SrfK